MKERHTWVSAGMMHYTQFFIKNEVENKGGMIKSLPPDMHSGGRP
jgi:hypothetical protein